MVDTIKLFVNVQNTFQALGIAPPLPVNPKWSSSLNYKNLFVLFEFASGSILTTGFYLFKGKSIKENAPTIFGSFGGLMCVLCFTIHIWKIDKILKLINDYEEFIERRK